jgi:hypothetical protein
LAKSIYSLAMHNDIANTNNPSMNAGSVLNCTSIHRPTNRNRNEEITRVKLHALIRMIWFRFLAVSLFLRTLFTAVTSFLRPPGFLQAGRICRLLRFPQLTRPFTASMTGAVNRDTSTAYRAKEPTASERYILG